MLIGGKINISVDKSYNLKIEELKYSVFIVKITDGTSSDDRCTISLRTKIKNVKGVWRPSYDREFSIYNRFSRNEPVLANFDSPVRCIFDFSDMNIAAVGINPENIPLLIHSDVIEETGEVDLTMEVYGKHDHVTIMLDTGKKHYSSAIRNIVKWMYSLINGENNVTEYSHLPVYSTWYSYHQNLSLEVLKKEIPIAESTGFGTVIIDDGWQTSDSTRGYRFCGDWQPSPSRIPDMKAFTDFIHDHGIRVLLWYALPLIGTESESFKRFSENAIGNYTSDVVVADPSNRGYIEFIRLKMEEAVKSWGFDGIKADFIDQFRRKERAVDPDIMKDNAIIGRNTVEFLNDVFEDYHRNGYDVEFRQFYFGPWMQHICTMIRAEDCPYDPVENRVRTINLRLSTFGPAVHSDPISWHDDEPVQDIVRYMLSCIHSVLQISVILEKQRSEVLDALKFWLSFSREHADSLIYGEIEAGSPSSSYPYVSVTNEREHIVTLFDQVLTYIPDLRYPVYIINATTSVEVTVLSSENAIVNAEYFDCRGKLLGSEKIELKSGPNNLSIEISGFMKIYH